MAKLLKYFLYTLFLPFWWVQRLIPRQKNICVFGAWNGHRYSDNSKYLYLYVREHHPEINAIWITREEKIKEKVLAVGGLAFLTKDFRGIYYCLLAKNVFLTSGKRDVNYLAINGANCVQLWHGSPLKKIGLDDRFSDSNTYFQTKIVAHLYPFLTEFNIDYILSNAQVFTDKMASSFNMPIAKVLETGCPRNDAFYSKEQDPYNVALRSRFVGCRLIYYMPTFRGHGKSKSLFTLPDFNLESVLAFLEANNLVFISKGHYVDNSLLEKNPDPKSRLIDLEDKDVNEINFMLKDADLLITDYSSAYFDFLLTEKPLIFAAFDLDEYLAGSREMYFNYEDVVAGPIVKNWTALMASLETIWDDQNFSRLVKEKNALFNKYHDADNCKRVFEALQNRSMNTF
ncbi:MAG: CDP-glycerol glycerophosphotransferase family protein [Flavobacteriaceae bacterium]